MRNSAHLVVSGSAPLALKTENKDNFINDILGIPAHHQVSIEFAAGRLCVHPAPTCN
jgi:hypothetical protein